MEGLMGKEGGMVQIEEGRMGHIMRKWEEEG